MDSRRASLPPFLSDLGAGELLQRLIAAEDFNRAGLARDLHDGVGQTLTACRLLLTELSRTGDAAHRAKIEQLQHLTTDLAKDLHQIALALRPAAVDDPGLAVAIENYLTDWSALTGIAASHHLPAFADRWPPVVEAVVYRIIQEALRNVARHSDAREVSVLAARTDFTLSVIIEDTGRGFDANRALTGTPTSHGLDDMRQRAALVNGELTIESVPSVGTTVYLRIPLGP